MRLAIHALFRAYSHMSDLTLTTMVLWVYVSTVYGVFIVRSLYVVRVCTVNTLWHHLKYWTHCMYCTSRTVSIAISNRRGI